MTDYSKMTLADARHDYLATSTTGMPIGGFISWAGLAVAAYIMGNTLPSWAVFVAAALPFPLSILIDKIRGKPSVLEHGTENPINQLFMQFIFVVALIIPFIIIAVRATKSLDLLILGLAILAGMMWVPHGWGADDRAGMIHFVMRAIICYAAYFFVPEPYRGAAIAGAAALTYVYAIAAMKKPESAQ